MNIPLIRSPGVTQTRLLDRYILPKIALTVITLASFAGTWLTMSTHGAGTWSQVLPRWLHLVTFGLLAGGYLWKALFARPAEQADQQAAFATFTAGQFRRFRRLARAVLPVFALTALWDAMRFARWGAGRLIWADLLLVALLVLAIGYDAFLRAEKEQPFAERPLAALILALLLLSGLAQAAFDVALAQAGQLPALLVRWLHLSAFGLWLGGAVWNIFIAVSAAREVVSVPVVVAAATGTFPCRRAPYFAGVDRHRPDPGLPLHRLQPVGVVGVELWPAHSGQAGPGRGPDRHLPHLPYVARLLAHCRYVQARGSARDPGAGRQRDPHFLIHKQ